MFDEISQGPLQGILEWASAGASAAFPVFVIVFSVDFVCGRVIAARFLVTRLTMVALRFPRSRQ